jgi:thiamine pyrophosphate-dependent acetolactate synthase large subunit-like protein
LSAIKALTEPTPNQSLTIHQIGASLKEHLPKDITFVIEAVSLATALSDQLQVSVPGNWPNCGGTGLGWADGAALGIKLGLDAKGEPNFVCQIVGDGAFLFGDPSAAAWVASRYGIPILIVVLNNKGTKALFILQT